MRKFSNTARLTAVDPPQQKFLSPRSPNAEAIAAFQKVISDYPQSDSIAPAYYKMGRSYEEGLKQIDLARKIPYTVETVGEELRVAVDIGTNGEVVLGSRERLWACSAPAGPALEGGQLRCGMRGAAGAIDRVTVGDDIHIHTIGDAARLVEDYESHPSSSLRIWVSIWQRCTHITMGVYWVVYKDP